MANHMRDRLRETMKAELAERVYPVFARDGLENVTADRAARAAGISRATFFRYFASKEDAVLTALRARDAHLARVHSNLDSVPGESLLELLRGSFEDSVSAVERDPEAMLERVRFVWETPSLRAGWAAMRREQQDALARALMPFCASIRAAQTAALITLTLYDHALERWLDRPDESFRRILDEAFDFASTIDRAWGPRS